MLDLETGLLRWTFPGRVQTEVAAAPGRVYVVAQSRLFAFDEGSGSQLWQSDVEAESVVATADAVLVRSPDRLVHAIDIATGRSLAATPDGLGEASFADAAHGVAVVRTPNQLGELVVVDLDTAAVLWQLDPPTRFGVAISAAGVVVIDVDAGEAVTHGHRDGQRQFSHLGVLQEIENTFGVDARSDLDGWARFLVRER